MAGTGLFAGLADGIWQQRQFAMQTAMEHAQRIHQANQEAQAAAAEKEREARDRETSIWHDKMALIAQENADTRVKGEANTEKKTDAVIDRDKEKLVQGQERIDNTRDNNNKRAGILQFEADIKKAIAGNFINNISPSIVNKNNATANSSNATAGLTKEKELTEVQKKKLTAQQIELDKARIKDTLAHSAYLMQQAADARVKTPFQIELLKAQSAASGAMKEAHEADTHLKNIQADYEEKYKAKMPTNKPVGEIRADLSTKITGISAKYGTWKDKWAKAHGESVKYQNTAYQYDVMLMGAGVDPQVPGKTVHGHEPVNEYTTMVKDTLTGKKQPVSVIRAMKAAAVAKAVSSAQEAEVAHKVAADHAALMREMTKRQSDLGHVLDINGKKVNSVSPPHVKPKSEKSVVSHAPKTLVISGTPYTKETLSRLTPEQSKKIGAQIRAERLTKKFAKFIGVKGVK